MPYYNTPISLTRLKKQNGNLTDPAKIILQSQQRQQMPGIQTSFGNLHLNRTADMASLSTGAAELAPNTPAFVPPPVPVNSPEMPAHLSTTRYTSAYQDILNAEQTPTSVSASMSPSSFGSSIGVAGPRVAFAATSVSGSSSTTSPIHRIKEIYRSHDPSFLASPALSTHTTPTIDGYGDISGHAHIHTHGHSSRASPHRVQSPSARLSQSFDQLLAEEAAGAVTHVPYANGAVGSGQQNHSLLEIELQDVKTRQERLLRTLRTKSDEYNNLVNEKNYREKMLLSEIRRHKMDHQLNARQSGEALRQGALRVSELENQLKDALEQHALARQQIARLKDDQERNVLKNDQMHSELVQQVQRHQQEMEEEGKREKEILAAAEKHDVHVQAVLATKVRSLL